MISRYDIIQYSKQNSDKLWYYLEEGTDDIIEKETNERVCSMDTYVQFMRAKLHCDFKSIWSCHATLDVVLECNQCGTIVFTGEDERYDSNLVCPHCGEYKYKDSIKFYTKEQIESDSELRAQIQFLKEDTKRKAEEYERYKKRGGLWDYQLFKKSWRWKKRGISVELDYHKHKGYFQDDNTALEISYMIKEKDGISFVYKWHWRIPLNPYTFYIYYIYRYRKCCHPSLRKYLPWQKKPTTIKEGDE